MAIISVPQLFRRYLFHKTPMFFSGCNRKLLKICFTLFVLVQIIGRAISTNVKDELVSSTASVRGKFKSSLYEAVAQGQFNSTHNSSFYSPEEILDINHVPESIWVSTDPFVKTTSVKLQRIRKRESLPLIGLKVEYNKAEKLQLLYLHNVYRRNVTPPAADMKYMEWDEELARLAGEWGRFLDTQNGCKLKHGMPPSASAYSGSIGQNLYVGGERTGYRALYLWYDENKWYNFDSNHCPEGEMCGHYTQMVWASSSKVGCEVVQCRDGVRFLVTCHYSPAGNVQGSKPYLIGEPCSQCDTEDGGLCYFNQCITRNKCNLDHLGCACNLKCHNCGELDRSKCSCKCKKGWDTPDCSVPCDDEHSSCGKNPGWPSSNFCYMNEGRVSKIYCRKMCGECRGVDAERDKDDLDNTCCRGKMCPYGQVLYTEEGLCKCHTLCPGPRCSSGTTVSISWLIVVIEVMFIAFRMLKFQQV